MELFFVQRKERLFTLLDEKKATLTAMADFLFDNPETAFEEHKAVDVLTRYLEKSGFAVERGVGALPTAFRAVYENGSGGPSIGLLCEYDALPGMGHGCAHHIQGPAIVGAAESIKAVMSDGAPPYRLVVYGTPGEEGGGGKIHMLENGCFRDIDLALMTHGGPATQTDVKSLALATLTVTFHGKSAHAALKPEQGRSALDGLLLCFQGVEFFREHVREDTRMHYTILDAGGPANVVPERAQGEFIFRSYSSVHLDAILERFDDIAKGAALMSGTTVTLQRMKRLESKIPVLALNELLMHNAELVDAPTRRPPREKTGSTDFGNVTSVLPGAVIRVAFVPEGTPSHSQEFLRAGKSDEAHAALLFAAKILAGTCCDILENPELIQKITADFTAAKKEAC